MWDSKEITMSKRNDPARLEAEAKELFEQMTKGRTETPEADQPPEDTPEEPEVLQEETPDPTDTVEIQAEEDAVEESVRSEDSELKLALQKAEKAMKGAQARMTKATQETADLKRQNADLIRSITELKGQLVESSKDESKLAQIREDYPDLAGPLLDELKRTQDEVGAAKEALAEQEQSKYQQIQAQAQAEHFERIRTVHPDVDQLIDTADWLNWLEEADSQTKTWIQEGSSNDVNTVLSRFKADMGEPAPTLQEQALERAKSVAEPKMPKARKSNLKGDKKFWTVDEIMRMPNKMFEKHQSEILKAMESGSIRR
jgi:chromosome segregation ATPase